MCPLQKIFCLVNRGDRICKLLNNDAEAVAFLDDEQPPSYLKSMVQLEDGTLQEEMIVRNSCYHICHQAGIDKLLKKYKSQITPDGKFMLSDDDNDLDNGTTTSDTESTSE